MSKTTGNRQIVKQRAVGATPGSKAAARSEEAHRRATIRKMQTERKTLVKGKRGFE